MVRMDCAGFESIDLAGNLQPAEGKLPFTQSAKSAIVLRHVSRHSAER
jgi:hypothetical protein